MSEISAAPAAASRGQALWDLPTRLFHWALVALIAFSWWSGKHQDMDRHRLSGYAILALLLFRIFWGFAGGRTARFAEFVRGPATVAGYVRLLVTRRYAPSFGHNPLGGWSVLAMLGTLGVMIGTGLFSVDIDGLEAGPFADRVSFDTGRAAAGIHAWCLDVLLALIAIHTLAIVAYAAVLRHDLVGPMITGRRRHRAGEDGVVAEGPIEDGAVAAPGGSWPRAAIGIIIAGGVAYAVAKGLRL